MHERANNQKLVAIAGMIAALAFVLSLAAAMNASGDEGLTIPESFAIPAETATVKPKLAFVLPSKDRPVGAAQGIVTPMQASVLVKAAGIDTDGNVIGGEGSGTLIGNGRVLTCWHIGKGMTGLSWTVEKEGIRRSARLLKETAAADLALLQISDTSLPSINVASEWSSLDRGKVTSIGRSGNGLSEWTVDLLEVNQKDVITSGQGIEGRSGGGLFRNGELYAVTLARFTSENKTLYASPNAISDFLSDEQTAKPPLSASELRWREWNNRTVEDAKSAGKLLFVNVTAKWCGPCRAMKTVTFADRRVHDALAAFETVTVDADKDADISAGFNVRSLPTCFVVTPDRTILKTIVGQQSPAQLLDLLAEYAAPQAMSAAASFEGWSTVQDWLKRATDIAGDGAVATIKWNRPDAAKALIAGKQASWKDVFGTRGRFEFTLTSAAKLPIHELKFNYSIDGKGRLTTHADPITYDIPLPGYGSVESQPTGSIALVAFTAYELLSWGYTLYEFLTPQVSVWPGEQIVATATLKDGCLGIDLGLNPPAIHVDWSLMFGLINIEYQRPLTGVLVTPESAVAQFHRSRVYRDVTIVGK